MKIETFNQAKDLRSDLDKLITALDALPEDPAAVTREDILTILSVINDNLTTVVSADIAPEIAEAYLSFHQNLRQKVQGLMVTLEAEFDALQDPDNGEA